jgi:hypothetical protein
MEGFLKSVGNFLSEHTAGKIGQTLQKLDWEKIVSDPMTWVIALPVILLLILRKAYRIILLGVSVLAVFALLHYTLPAPGQSIPLERLVMFMVGGAAVAGVNIYFLIMRE